MILKVALAILILVAVGVALVAVGGPLLTARLSRAAEQPIAFSHPLHASELGIECAFCHRNATKGVEAGIPAVEQCMFCHVVIGTGKPEVEKLRSAYGRQQPINWQRVYRVPDVVRFTHEPHLQAKVSCDRCHGEVEKMSQVRQARPLGMAQCVACHRENNAPTDCTTCHY